ncbi:unnamed protein product [Musa hybrid cultivar]
MELLGAEEEAPQGAGPPGELAAFLQPRSVSTGLGLSLDDRRVASSSGEWPLIILPTIDEDIDREVRRIDADIDWFIKSEVTKEAWLVQNDTIESCSAEYSDLLCVQLLLEPSLRNWHVLSFDRGHHFFYIKSLRKGIYVKYSDNRYLLLAI